MTLKIRVTGLGMALAFIPVLLSSIFLHSLATDSSRDALSRAAEKQLTSSRDLTGVYIEDYFLTIRKQLLTLSNNRMIMSAMRDFSSAFDAYLDESQAPVSSAMKTSVADYYSRQFGQTYKSKNQGRSAAEQTLLSGLDDTGTALQFAYISDNRHPLGEKDALNRAAGQASYHEHHEKYHSHIRDFLNKFNFYDIFLVDHKTGNIVYSVYKELDYATSLLTGPYADSGIAEAFKAVYQSNDPGKVALVDFKSYLPSYDAPASFIASPIFDQGEKLGVLIFQMPVDEINRVMTQGQKWLEHGFGESGETYLVGSDFTMRSMSRFMIEDADNYFTALQSSAVDSSVIEKIRDQGTTIKLQPVKTEGTRAALKGDSGFAIFPDYRGVNVLSSYRPLDIEGLDWVIMSEIDEAEAFAAVDRLSSDLLIDTGVIVALVLGLAAIGGGLLSRSLVNPINATTEAIRDIVEGEGDLTRRLDEARKDELGQLAYWFNRFIERFQRLIDELNGATQHILNSSDQLNQLSNHTQTSIQGQHQQTELAATAMNQMQATVNEVAANASLAADKAQQAQDTTATASQTISDSSYAITQLASDIGQAGKVIQDLHGESEEVDSVIDVIGSIAEQTNLLALNAAIEAARAGESGRGFAVVADEVRNLAQKTQESTEKIKSIIERLQQGTRSAVAVMEAGQANMSQSVSKAQSANDEFMEITRLINGINEANTMIATASEQQRATAEEINSNVTNISDISSQNTARTDEVKSSVQGLLSLAEQLQQQLSHYRT